MNTLLKLVETLLVAIPLFIFLSFILQVLFTSVGYLFGYLYDSIFGDWLIQFGHHFGKKCNGIKKIRFVKKIWAKMQPKNLYLRYETPFIAYCFSYMAIYLVSLIIPTKNDFVAFFCGMSIYIILYFFGMYRRCEKDSEYYTKVLKNNLSFLKLSFWPLGGLITIIGFMSTIFGKTINDFSSICDIIDNIISEVEPLFESQDLMMMGPIVLVSCAGMILLLYLISIPVQVISYFIILIINYVRENKRGYSKLVEIYWEIVKKL